MHPNLTKGFGMIGPKDFFPLLDFAFMPNNSLPPRYAGTPPQHTPARAVLWGERPGRLAGRSPQPRCRLPSACRSSCGGSTLA